MQQDLSNSMLLLFKQIDIQGEINKYLELENTIIAFFDANQNYFSFEKSLILETYLLSIIYSLNEARQSNAKFIDKLYQYLVTAGEQKLQ